MTYDAALADLLLGMGIGPELAREAASRYSEAQTEAAVNWIFGDGANWRPGTASGELPSYGSTESFEAIEHAPPQRSNQSMSTFSALGPGSMGPTSTSSNSFHASQPSDQQQRFASNNPFNQAVQHPRPLPPAPNTPSRPKLSVTLPSEPLMGMNEDDDEDEELRRAIAMSQEEASVGDMIQVDSNRQERERSVRASAPPPSPSFGDGDDAQKIGPLFGPSEKNDLEGKLAMVPASVSANKEEEDYQRAIQESMMTASFHSASALPDERPSKLPRPPGAPLVYCATTQPSYTANFLQALAAVPQLRDVFAEVVGPLVNAGTSDTLDRGRDALQGLQTIFSKQDTVEDDYIDVDTDVDRILNAWKLWDSTVPPINAITNEWLDQLSHALLNLPHTLPNDLPLSTAASEFLHDREKFLHTHLTMAPTSPFPIPSGRTHVLFHRESDAIANVHSALAQALWSPDSPASSLKSLADVIFVVLRRTPGISAPAWKLDETVVLDRYLRENAAWATQLRAQQAVAQGEVRRLKDQIARLQVRQSQDLPKVLESIIKYLASSPSEDSIQAETRSELVAELKQVAERIQTQIAELQGKVKEMEPEASGTLFDGEPVDRSRHVYELRAVCWHDGFTTPGKHLYAYVRNGAGWWRVQDHEAEKVEFDKINADTTGQFTDGGPYVLIYSRQGPRPPAPVEELEIEQATDADTVDAMEPIMEEAQPFQPNDSADDDQEMEVDPVSVKEVVAVSGVDEQGTVGGTAQSGDKDLIDLDEEPQQKDVELQ